MVVVRTAASRHYHVVGGRLTKVRITAIHREFGVEQAHA